MAKKNLSKTNCVVDYAFQRIGGKYKGRIIWYLNDKTVLRYGELRKTVKGVTAKCSRKL